MGSRNRFKSKETKAAEKQARIEAEIARIKGGGRTPFSTDAAALANLNEKLKKVKGNTTTKKGKLKITPAHDNPGAARAKEAAKARRDAGLNTVTGEKKKTKKSNGSSTTTTRGTGQGNKSLNRNAKATTPKKRKRIKSELWD